MNKIYVVFMAARQINGEYIMVKTEMAFKTSAQAEEYVKKLNLAMPDGSPKAMNIKTPMGEFQCQVELAIHEVILAD